MGISKNNLGLLDGYLPESIEPPGRRSSSMFDVVTKPEEFCDV